MKPLTLSTNGILKLLKDRNPHNTIIKPLVLKELRDVLAPVIHDFFQTFIDTGRVPSDWKNANVCPIFKKGDKCEPSNYRPISLTCVLCKLLEHIVASNLIGHLDNNGILYDLQHGFRSKRSCETQLVMFLEDLLRNTIEGQQTDLILLDFSKAFDKVNHANLLYKLQQYGIRSETLKWIEAFLSNRLQQVVVENEESDTVPVTSGVPQDSLAQFYSYSI